MTTAADPTLTSAPTASGVRNLQAGRWPAPARPRIPCDGRGDGHGIDATIVNVAIPAITADSPAAN